MDIKYKIQFHTDWHCGSGLAAGADVDALVVKDKEGMPFIPGKTLKGLLREAVEDLLFLENGEQLSESATEMLIKTFGNSSDRNARKVVVDEDKKMSGREYKDMGKGAAFFTNASLNEKEYTAIVSNKAQQFLYRSIASTEIDSNGIAKDHSLRKIQVVIPCTLEGEILSVPEEASDTIAKGLSFIKRLGQNRNRGLGRCTITLNTEGK